MNADEVVPKCFMEVVNSKVNTILLTDCVYLYSFEHGQCSALTISSLQRYGLLLTRKPNPQ